MGHLTSNITGPLFVGAQQLGHPPNVPLLLASQISQFSASITTTTPVQQGESRGGTPISRIDSHNTLCWESPALPPTLPQGIPTTILSSSQNVTTSNTQSTITSPALYGNGILLAFNSFISDPHPSLVSIGQSLPLILCELIQQIRMGKFVDFSDFLPAKCRQLAPTSYSSQLLLVQLQDVHGEQQRRLIPDFPTWSQCFAIYTAVLGADQPHCLPELMAYQIEIAKCAKKYKWPSWIIYDLNFRQEAASNPRLSWATVEPSIYTQCFTGMAKDPSDLWCKSCQSLDHTTAFCPLTP